MKASDLREKSVEDLRELEKSLMHDVFQNRLKNFTNRLDDTSTIRKTKRELARVTTLLREVELGIGRAAKTPAAAKGAPEAKAEPGAQAEAKPAKAATKTASKKTESTGKAPKSSKKGEAKQS